MARFYNVFIFYLILPYVLYPQSQDIKFEHISVEQGLPSTTVNCIAQDQNGFMWFGTDEGLCRFDGFNLKIYQHQKYDKNSLNNNDIMSLFVDNTGAFWVGTKWLHLYNDRLDNFIRFHPDSLVKGEHIKNIVEDRYGILWINIMRKYLLRFDRIKEDFTAVYFSTDSEMNIQNKKIQSILICQNNYLWIATSNGLYKHALPPQSGKSKRTAFRDTVEVISYDKKMPYGVSNNRVKCLFNDHKQNIWFTYGKGRLGRYNKQDNTFINYPVEPDNKHNISLKAITIINENVTGKLLVGTIEGCSIFDPVTGKYIDTIFDNKWIVSYYRDRTGVEWIGTFYDGVLKVSNKNKKFSTQWMPVENFIFVDNKGIVWLGSRLGLHELDRETGENSLHKYKKGNLVRVDENEVLALCEENDNLFWICLPGGLYQFDKETKKFSSVAVPLLHEGREVICRDKSGILWLGGVWGGGGLYRYDPFSGIVTVYTHENNNKNSISNNHIVRIFEDSRENLWVGTEEGLNKFDRSKNQFINYFVSGRESERYEYDECVIDIIEPQDTTSKTLWIVGELGLFQFDRESGQFTICKLANGQHMDNSVTGAMGRMAEDGDGNIWFSTINGLGKYDTKNKTFKKYDQSDGLYDNAFTHAHFKSKSGEMFFGGYNSFTAFFPDSIKDDPFVPEIVFTRFKKMNNEVKLDTSLLYIKKIPLAHDENVFSLEYTALNFKNPSRNHFAHKLEGFDPEWIYTGNKHEVTYTNLDPGEYTFCVKGSNNDGVWNEVGTSVKIIIRPPWWRTNWAYVLYFLTVSIIILIIWRFQVSRLDLKHQLEIDHLRAENLEEMDRLKSRFFANISHEFRTPLTLIKGPVKQILDGEFAGNLKEQCKMILRNSDRLLSLINQILDLSKLDSGGMKLQVSRTDVIKLLKGQVLSFSSLAEQKKITLKFEVAEKSFYGYIDRDKIEKIMTNLLSNAFKFTPHGGKIVIQISTGEVFSDKILNNREVIDRNASPRQFPISNHAGRRISLPADSDFVEITISNTGAGIPPDQLGKIFDRFYQTDNSYLKDSEGSGIGLALAKELVEAHHGSISVSSNLRKHPPQSPLDRGASYLTTFTILLPINKEHFKPEEIVNEAEEKENVLQTGVRRPETGKDIFSGGIPDEDSRFQIPDTKEQSEVSNRPPVSGHRSPLVLIVEDNPDVTSYMSSFLEKDYHIITAENGKTGLKKALDKFPDLIISDVMMPEMDGFEMCRKIKTDERISHIPVILLTAKADLDSKIDGLGFGADDYVTKPFEARELQIRSKNLIDQRRKLREKFSQLIDLKPGDISASSMDEQLMERLLSVFEDHIDNPKFGIVEFAREVGISRVHLNRKLQALTNHSTHDFIRTLRLQQAARLLSNASGTVSEIAYKVGFNNLSHFSKAFRKHFGQLPSTFTKKKI